MLIEAHILTNLYLALVSPIIGMAVGFCWWRYPAFRKMTWLWGPLLFLWLGFLPNTVYLLTEWRHFLLYVVTYPNAAYHAAGSGEALLPFLGLATFYVLYSAAGLLTFSIALWPLEQIFQPGRWGKGAFFVVCALGVYLGLIQRFNSWDLWHHPRRVMYAILEAVTRPEIVALTLAFAAVIWFNYWLFEVFVDGLLLRVRRARYRRAQAQAARGVR